MTETKPEGWTSNTGVHVDLGTPANNTGDAQGDSYANIQTVKTFSSAAHEDKYVSDSVVEHIFGSGGQ